MKQCFSFLSIVTILALTGCVIEPTVFDVPQSQWHTLTPEQKQEVIKGYNERKHAEIQIAPIKQAIGVADQYLENKHTENFLKNSHMTHSRTHEHQDHNTAEQRCWAANLLDKLSWPQQQSTTK